MLYRVVVSEGWGLGVGGWGGGGGKLVRRNLYFQLFSQSSNPLQQLDFMDNYFWSSTNFIVPLELLIGFFLVNLGEQC